MSVEGTSSALDRRAPASPQAAAISAALAALQPVVALLLDTGINTNEVARLLRWAFVEEAASRQRRVGKKPSASRIAVATGLSRAEVSQLLASPPPTSATLNLAPRASDKVIAAWRSDPDYLEPDGKPRPLLYSDGRHCFSELVHSYAPDIPPRAMLTEMVASKLVTDIGDRHYAPVASRNRAALSQQDAVSDLGVKLCALGSTLLHNLQHADQRPLFETMISVTGAYNSQSARVSKELARRCKTFSQSVERYLLDQSEAGARIAANHDEPSIGVILAVVKRRASDASKENFSEDPK